jgi:iron complex outermembrane receptor protein
MNRFLALILMFSSMLSFAQQADTVFRLPAVEVFGGRVASVTAGSQVKVMDSAILKLYSAANLVELLEGQSSVIIRSSGPGESALLSSRGLQSTQSLVTWEGISLNSPTHGSSDISMMPVFAFDNISMLYGGGSAIAGSGALGGNLLLSGNEHFKQPFSVKAQVAGGSYGTASSALRISAGNEALSYSMMASANRSENNYKYTDLSGKRISLDNSSYKSINTIHKVGWKIAPGHLISLSGWYQASGRDIPPTMVMTQSTQHQDDKALRLSLQYKWLKHRSILSSGFAYIHDYMHYSEAISQTEAVYNTDTYSPNVGYKTELFKNIIVEAGVTGRILVADVPYYNGIKRQSEMATYVSVVQIFPSIEWKSAINLRQDLVQGYKVPFCPSIGAEGRIKGKLGGRINVSRNFRVPTLNDRFWQPGGNPDLNPESSYNVEAGLTYKYGDLNRRRLFGDIGIQAYTAWVKDLILWVPSNASIWSPQNVEKLWSRGIEASSALNYHMEKWNARFDLLYTWSPSTFSGDKNEDNSYGNQLIYIPLHTLKANLKIQCAKIFFRLNGMAESRRFTRKDNGTWLPAIGLLNFSGGREFRVKDARLTFRLDMSNILNTSYQAVQYYPAPGISFNASLLAEF